MRSRFLSSNYVCSVRIVAWSSDMSVSILRSAKSLITPSFTSIVDRSITPFESLSSSGPSSLMGLVVVCYVALMTFARSSADIRDCGFCLSLIVLRVDAMCLWESLRWRYWTQLPVSSEYDDWWFLVIREDVVCDKYDDDTYYVADNSFFRAEEVSASVAPWQMTYLVLLHFCRAWSDWIWSTLHMRSFLVCYTCRIFVAFYWYVRFVMRTSARKELRAKSWDSVLSFESYGDLPLWCSWLYRLREDKYWFALQLWARPLGWWVVTHLR